MFSKKRLLIATFVALIPTISFADVVVSYYEPLQRSQLVQTDKTTQSFAPQSGASLSTTLQFEALGQNFELLLQSNERIAESVVAELGVAGLHAYRGELAGKPDSWARIVMFDGIPRGIMYDGEHMYAIEAPGDSAVATNEPVIYRLSDVSIGPGTMSCGTDALAGNAATIVKSITSSTQEAVARGPGAVTEITMSAIGDYEFTMEKGGDAAAAAAITTRLNNVDGYFSEQVGVQISVPDPIETYEDNDDPFTDTTDSDLLLDQLSEYRTQTPSHNSHGLTHLFTGKELEGTTVGVAWQGTLCMQYFGAGLTEARDSAFIDSLIATHEIGHNFGADHDGEAGTACEADTDPYIMSASVNGSERFSDCSIAIMQAEASAASCVTALPTVDVGIKPVDDLQRVLQRVFVGVESTIEYEVSSNGLVNAPDVATSMVLPSFLDLDSATSTLGSCVNGAGTVDCTLGELAGISTQIITLTVTPNSLGNSFIDSSVTTSDVDERAANNQHSLQLISGNPVDLLVNAPATGTIFVDETITVTATLQNVSDTDATDVSLSVSLQPGIRASAADWSIGTCIVENQQVDCTASNFAAQSSSDFSVTATALSRGERDVTLNISASEADTNLADNTASGSVTVRSTDNGGGGDDSGGGAVGLFGLWLAALALLRLRRRQPFVRSQVK